MLEHVLLLPREPPWVPDKEGLSVLGGGGRLVPPGLHVMRGPLAKITRHVLLLEVP